MGERVVQFGEGGRLSGILNAPPENSARPVVLLLNAGIIHRIGAHRLNVKLARRLAACGFESLRFDLCGMGESAPAPGHLGHEQQTVADISAAIDFLQDGGRKAGFVGIGMCSGADDFQRAALADERLTGLILLDPHAYPAKMAMLEDTLRRYADPHRWLRKMRGAPSPAADDNRDGLADQDRVRPPLETFGAELETLCGISVNICVFYTAAVRRDILRPSQFFQQFSGFDLEGRVCVHVNPDFTHTYTTIHSQTVLFTEIECWLKQRYAEQSA